MVYLNIDFYRLREELLKEIFRRVESKKAGIEYAWLLYALTFNGLESNPVLEEKIREIEEKILSEDMGKQDRDLAIICFGLYLSKEKDVIEKAKEKMSSIIERSMKKVDFKFNVLNDPEQVFFLSLSLKKAEIAQDVSSKLIELIKKNISGTILRKILFYASLKEIDSEFIINEIITEIRKLNATEIEDIILSLWFIERYKVGDPINFWKLFENTYPILEIMKFDETGYISSRGLALLYEATFEEIKNPNPDMLFDLYPFSPEIREISKKHFKNKRYVSAVFEATKKLNEKIQYLTGITNKSEAELVQATMKQIDNPESLKIKFNNYLNEISGKNEQKGLALITEGIFSAFRNPKGHKPEDHPLVSIEAYEALAQLIIIDYIWKRLESAEKRR